MRILSIILLILSLAYPCWSAETFTIGVGSQTFTTGGSQSITVTGGTPPACPSGTYLFAWNGDYGPDTDKGCFTSGAAQKDGTVALGAGGGLSASFGRTGVGFKITDEDQYISWAVSGGDGINIVDGTIWIDLYVFDATPDDSIVIFEAVPASYDTRNYINIVFNSSGRLTVSYRGTNIGKNVAGTKGLSTGWNTIAYSWQKTGTDTHGSKVNDNDWEEEAESLSDWEAAASEILIGERYTGGLWVDTLYIDNVYSLTGYKTAHP